MSCNRSQRHRAGLLLSLLFLLSMVQPGQLISDCGYCVCDRPTISCDFNKAKSRIVDNTDLTVYVPSSSLLRRQGLNPASYSELYINCKNARVLKLQRLTGRLLSDFVNLTRLSVLKCDLVAIEVGALDALSQLKEVDLSDNQLQKLPPGFLNGKSLTTLRLGENHQIQLAADTFRGLRLDRLLLSKCGLTEFPLTSLSEISGLKELTLSHNSIQSVPRAAKEFVYGLQVFYLDDNPLACNCQNRWLREIAWDRVSPPLGKSSQKDQLPRCRTPQRLLNAEIGALSATELSCAPPHLVSIDVQLGINTGRMACTADTDQPDRLVWTSRQIAGYSSFEDVQIYQSTGSEFVREFTRRPEQQRQQQHKYLLTASTEDGRQSNITLTLQWPTLPQQQPTAILVGKAPNPLPPLPPVPGDAINNGAESEAAGPDYFSRKQFTLVEMTVAVIGTFLATAVIFLLVCQFTRWYARRDKKRWATYAAHPYSGYNYTSGTAQQQQQQQQQYLTHRPPSHEYDVPRMESLQMQHQQQQQQQLSPKITQHNCAAEFEFVDYNGRMLYNRV